MSAFDDEIDSFSNDLCDCCPMLVRECGDWCCPIGDDIKSPHCYFRSEHEDIAKAFESVPETAETQEDEDAYEAAMKAAEDIVSTAKYLSGAA